MTDKKDNSGHYNSGYSNSGNSNSGSYNSGDRNSVSYNSGDYNSGYCNSGDRNSGAFNRDCPKMRLFEKELDMTVEEFNSEYSIYMNLPLNRWVYELYMTDEEKSEIDGWETMGGYLKTLGYKEACRLWWEENQDDHERFLTLPGFDAEIFKDITGIDVTKSGETIEIEGKELTVNQVSEKLGYKVKIVEG